MAGFAPDPADARHGATSDPIPVLAHYYIWFDASSWGRAKIDYPALGRYSSDEERVMQRHVAWAQEAGIDAFVVSWKSTPALDARLEQLVGIAADAGFRLAITYQALDFDRNPLPIDRVQRDLERFADRYADDPVFDVFGRPLVIWTGTWAFEADDIARVVDTVDDDLLVLASERDVEGIERLRGIVDGDAYYWSSVDPQRYGDVGGRLEDMAQAVRADGGLWIAPVAPGFDARLVGGTSVVERRDGETLRERWSAALESSPDAIGLISWNEFSENTHVEPSDDFGTRYLEVVADLTGAGVPQLDGVDASDGGGTVRSFRPAVLGGLLAVLAIAAVIVIRRRETS